MSFEVELKAWVDDPVSIEKKLIDNYDFRGSCIKRDTYYITSDKNKKFRLRIQENASGGSKKFIVTIKDKKIKEGMEENKETEFSVSDDKSFISFIEKLDCRVFSKKTKYCKLFMSGKYTIELNNVESLGYFIEIERLLEERNSGLISRVRKDILDIIDKLGIAKSRIESRTYNAMLSGK